MESKGLPTMKCLLLVMCTQIDSSFEAVADMSSVFVLSSSTITLMSSSGNRPRPRESAEAHEIGTGSVNRPRLRETAQVQ